MMSSMRREVAFVTCIGVFCVSAGCDVNQVQPELETGSDTVDDSGSVGDSSSSTSSSSGSSTSTSDSSDSSGGDGVMGCDGDGEAMQPFGNHEFNYADGVIIPSHKTQSELDSETIAFYQSWKNKWLRQGCGGYYVDADIGGATTVSEAHGYGMIIAAYMAGAEPDAQAIFDGMFDHYRDHPSNGDARLMAWYQDTSCNSANGLNSAADGDLDIAYALLLADKQWGSSGAVDYAFEADRILDGIWQSETGDGYIHLGDWVSSGDAFDATRSSDFMPSHLASFEAALGNGNFGGVRDASYSIIDSVQTANAPTSGLVPDFILSAASGPYPAYPGFLEGDYDGEYNFNACRVPWRVGVDAVINGDSRAATIVDRMTSWARSNTGDSASGIRAGYWLDGDMLPNRDYVHLAYMAPFGVAAMTSADNQNWLNQIWNQVVTYQGNDTYYGDTIAMIDLIIMSGNYWAPENAPCG
jgi:endo-1,4-beta-D-glucanase Y